MYTYDYPHPAVATDRPAFARTDEGTRLLLIQRKDEPCKGKWAFPGGSMDTDEITVDAVRCELKEETGLVVGELHHAGIFDTVGRDPRERITAVAYYTILNRPAEVSGLDGVAQAKWFLLTELPDLVFDHKEIPQETEGVLGDG